ncbi:hypothetical protein FGADI_13094 [Fusarium gaditjirri]|uniref:Protein kinase domain-containing protein n=1 Tax=Fusarium gaditjirri TaxID=282569 RepID=A0A8H4WMG6_9HYPO|nr:hypothetical protein FGADI_13094 [Fusarium gaditjirri]
MDLQNNYEQTIVRKLAQYRPLRTQRYASVNVLVVTWRDHDLGHDLDQEVEELKNMFRHTFNYTIWPFRIPSTDAERSLNLFVAQFVMNFGGEDDLAIIFYSGHGGGEGERQACTWAARRCGGPTLDWSNIQPQLHLALGDVALILDCCYAGQAARPHTSHRVEFLAATDKDNWTPAGTGKWPSFTKVFMREMIAMAAQGPVTLAALQSRMVRMESGLRRQPLYVSLAGDASEGPIRFIKLALSGEDSPSAASPPPVSASINLIYLRLCLFDPLDELTSPNLLRWLTRDSPASVEDIQLIDKAVSQAQDLSRLGTGVFETAAEQGGDQMLSFLSKEGQAEAQRLLKELKLAVYSSTDVLSEVTGTSKNIIHSLRQASSRLMDFIGDSLATMDKSSLDQLEHKDSAVFEDMRSRIRMRLALLDDNKVSENVTRVTFSDKASSHQRLRFGKQADRDVLVEYIYYHSDDPDAFDRVSYQIKRVAALLAECRNDAFHCLGGSGFCHEQLYGPRFGLVHPLTARVKYVPLNNRIRLTGIICDAILNLHSIGWYHKNIKGENIILFNSLGAGVGDHSVDGWDFERPFLIGFDCSRPVDAETRDTIDFETANNIYRHPDRWGRTMPYQKHHDIYSLGILMLEIGGWLRIASLDIKKRSFSHVSDPEALRTLYLKVASSKLSHTAGACYAEAVKTCLEKRQWKDLEDWESQKLVREKVLKPLRECADALG